MAHTFDNLIGGQWKPSRNGATLENENPALRLSVIGLFQSSTVEDALDAISAAELAFRAWRRTTVPERQRYVRKFLTLLRESREDLARIVTLENGKTVRESLGEVDSALVEGEHHLNCIAALQGYAAPRASQNVSAWMQYRPLGVVGVISPWNFPMNVMCRKVLPALLTGNTVVFKPASFTPWSGVFMATLFERAGLPPGVLNCITGRGSEIGQVIVSDPRVRAISFTGSTEVGKTIQAKASANLTRTQLELGGKNALIVMDDADLPAALDATIVAAFSNAGQWCTSTSRLLLHRSIASHFLDTLRSRCDKMSVGDGLLETTDMGPVAGRDQYFNICAAIRTALEDGARPITEVSTSAEGISQGYFIRPTVFVDVKPEMAVWREEVFGPVLAVCEFSTIGEALALANDSIYGLSSAIFTKSLETAQAYVDGIEAGLAHVNVHTGYKEAAMPFGGIKQSGAGLPENGKSGLEFFVDQKAVYIRG